MKKLILFISLCLFACPAYSQTSKANSTQIGSQQSDIIQDSDTEGADDYYRELIAPEYGSDQSPAFMNRENINPSESSYSSGFDSGAYCDGSDDSGNYGEPDGSGD